MAVLGFMNHLVVVKCLDFGVYLDGGELGEILLPRLQVPANCIPGSELDVFLYHDTENRLIATIQRPKAAVGEVGFMAVRAVNEVGAFMDWGIPKDLFIPYGLQTQRMLEGKSYLVYVYLDRVSGRITGSTKLERHLAKTSSDLNPGDQIDLLIGEPSDAGFKTIINHSFWGFLYHNDIFQELRTGMKLPAFVKNIREDGKIDVCLQAPGYEKVEGVAANLLEALRTAGGSLPVTDKTPTEEIRQRFGVSKKTFKKAVGSLLKAGLITLDPERIVLRSDRP